LENLLSLATSPSLTPSPCIITASGRLYSTGASLINFLQRQQITKAAVNAINIGTITWSQTLLLDSAVVSFALHRASQSDSSVEFIDFLHLSLLIATVLSPQYEQNEKVFVF
jgi:hypothetical protein